MSDARARIEEDAAPGSREPRCSLKAAQGRDDNPYMGNWRPPADPDEQGAVSVVELLFAARGKRDRMAFFRIDGTEQCRIVFLDRAAQPRVHASREDHPQPAPSRQSVAPPSRQTDNALPLWGGTPGCAGGCK